MMKIAIPALILCVAGAIAFVMTRRTEEARSARIVREYSLRSFDMRHFGLSKEEIAKAQANGLSRTDLPAIASGLQWLGGDKFVSITDRGPTFKRSTPPPGRVFLLPSYTPSIVPFRTKGSDLIPEGVIRVVVDVKDTPATGISNSETEDSVPFDSPSAEKAIPYNPNGLDLEDLHTLSNGEYISVDEYGPSVVILSGGGMVLVRYTPQGKTLDGAAYPVRDMLPAILSQRRSNRGFESVAVSRDGRTAYTMTQSPLGSADSGAPTENSRVLRILRLDVSDPLNAKVAGQFVLLLSRVTSYPSGNQQQDLKVSAAAWVGENKLLVLERSDKKDAGGAKLLLVDLKSATDVRNRIVAQTVALEDPSLDFASANISPATSAIVYESEETPELTDFKLEGLCILNANEVAISNDNDFGIGDNVTGTPTRLWVIRLRDPLPRRP